ncbi:hypothetical protein BV898_03832 [Hypsibius exemplaris]|uniref:Uncharacterized protein n=1 Tax=Hypsibius exemplaris TaxID=2072580 RepID=A0A1W0X4P9_HYPEX|nr:hypothetical protein BV898_03832 [Hypsibius exemplaris]
MATLSNTSIGALPFRKQFPIFKPDLPADRPRTNAPAPIGVLDDMPAMLKAADLTIASDVQLMPPFRACGAEEETAQVPVKESGTIVNAPNEIEQGTKGHFVNMCVEPYAASCNFPGSFVAFRESCSLQCQCIKQDTTDYKYAACRSLCTRPPNGLRCFSSPEAGNCCPTFTDCVTVPATFKGEWVKDETAYHSRSFRCTGQETLDSASCLMLVKEAIPDQNFSTRFRATCTCTAGSPDTFTIQMFNSVHAITLLEKPQKFLLVKTGGKIRAEKFS